MGLALGIGIGLPFGRKSNKYKPTLSVNGVVITIESGGTNPAPKLSLDANNTTIIINI